MCLDECTKQLTREVRMPLGANTSLAVTRFTVCTIRRNEIDHLRRRGRAPCSNGATVKIENPRAAEAEAPENIR